MSPTRWIVLLVTLLAAVAAFIGYGAWRESVGEANANARWQAAVAQMQAKAATRLGEETRKVLALERQIAEDQAQLEALYEKRRNDSKAAGLALDRAAAAGGGVFIDPHGGGGCRGPAGQGAAAVSGRAGDRAEAGGVLSVQLSQLLRRTMREADDINDAYALCRDETVMLRQRLNEEDSEGVAAPPE